MLNPLGGADERVHQDQEVVGTVVLFLVVEEKVDKGLLERIMGRPRGQVRRVGRRDSRFRSHFLKDVWLLPRVCRPVSLRR